MSGDRHTEEERDPTPYARVAKRPRDVYAPALYMGTQRAPARPDERGALPVVDLVFGDRALIFAIAGDADFRRVLILRDAAHPRGAEAGNEAPSAQGGAR